MPDEQLHRSQIYILYALRRSIMLRYTDLRQPTGLESDAFKFHLQKLVKRNLVIKNGNGQYELTAIGKELANNLDRTKRQLLKQPKLSVLLIASRLNEEGKKEYLMQQRLRNPFYGFWGCITGPVQWGELPEDTAGRELKKQTGLSGKFRMSSFYRKRDYTSDDSELLEDKLFSIIEVTHLEGTLSNAWNGGHNAWLSKHEITKLKAFNTIELIELVSNNTPYYEGTTVYSREEY